MLELKILSINISFAKYEYCFYCEKKIFYCFYCEKNKQKKQKQNIVQMKYFIDIYM